jgi:nicotinamide N-methyltransferase
LLANLVVNAKSNISDPLPTNVQVQGHLWGDNTSKFATGHSNHYTRVLAADTLWIEAQHENLTKSMVHFMSKTADARSLVIAGFHSGRTKVAHFFEVVPKFGLEIDTIFEIDMDGKRRHWDPQRPGTISDNKYWVVAALLKWSEDKLRRGSHEPVPCLMKQRVTTV